MTHEPCNGAAAAGGRLKFFKDGKFILELARAREGERVAWVSVPRKTFWPPPAPQPPPPHRTASLSVSDDNSSIQSSPWQRDHCWKQSTPQRGLSRELTGVYLRPVELPSALLSMPTARRKRRRPFDCTPVALPNGLGVRLSNGAGNHSHDGDENENSHKNSGPAIGDKKSVPSEKFTGLGKFKFFKQMCETVKGRVTLKVYRKIRNSKKRKELCKIVEMLNDKVSSSSHMMVSPRKRILRELEKVNSEDLAGKRSRSRISSAAAKAGPSHAQTETPTCTATIPAPGHVNGTPPSVPRRETPTSKPVSNYSIHSLLSMSEENPTRRSPETFAGRKSSHIYNNFVSQKTDSPVSVHSPDLSSSPEGLDRHRGVRPSSYAPHSFYSPGHSGHSTASPRPPDKYYYQDAYAVSEENSPIAYHQLYPPAAYMPSTTYLSASYPSYDPRAHPPLWLPCPILPPGPWAPLSQPLLTDHLPREDTSSDLPLNLSKH